MVSWQAVPCESFLRELRQQVGPADGDALGMKTLGMEDANDWTAQERRAFSEGMNAIGRKLIRVRTVLVSRMFDIRTGIRLACVGRRSVHCVGVNRFEEFPWFRTDELGFDFVSLCSRRSVRSCESIVRAI